MKEIPTPLKIMENMVAKLQLAYPMHEKRADGIIQFYFTHKGQNIDCYMQSLNNELRLINGVATKPTVSIQCSFYDWFKLAEGRLNPVWGMVTGRLKFKGKTSFFKILPKKSFAKDLNIPKDSVTDFERNPQKYWKKPQKVVVLSSSPRGENGYTDFYLEPFIKGMKKHSEVELVHLNRFKITPCDGCFYCWMNTPGQCRYHEKDDFTKLADILYTADIIVYAFPIYADGIPGILKNYFDRSVSRAYPYMIEGLKRVRHPRMRIHENQSMVIFSICGFFETINFNPVHAYFKALSHNRHCPVIGEIYRPTALGLHSNPFLFQKLENILFQLEKAGEQIVLKGKMERKTRRIINQEFPYSSWDISKTNEWWDEKKGSKDYNY
ncbi:MAG: NAD(P)H-dependent oxidoreductase [Bacteroidales bacterium]